MMRIIVPMSFLLFLFIRPHVYPLDQGGSEKVVKINRDTATGPLLVLSDTSFDFGKVKIGDAAVHVFVVSNIGTDTLRFNAIPSCGCTSVVLDRNHVPPGQNGKLRIAVVTAQKAPGNITKFIAITSNSRDGITRNIPIHLQIVPPDKVHEMSEMHIDGVFKGNCASCHVDKGKGLMAKDLYYADCAVCHGKAIEHKTAPDLYSDRMMAHDSSSWSVIIAHGLAGTNMPAFATKSGGPLGDAEIASVAGYLTHVRKYETVLPTRTVSNH